MTIARLLVLDEDTFDRAKLEVELPDPPLAFDDLVEAYDSAHDSPAQAEDYLKRIGPWAERAIWPLVEKYKYTDGDVSVLVTFTEHDPKGENEMEFYMENGRLL